MEKNIPIDKLFKDQLSQGEEQLNLGAWANMERLLDGKNPYQEVDDAKKKRRILPFLLLFTILTGALTAGLYHKNHSKKDTNSSSIALNSSVQKNEPSTNETEKINSTTTTTKQTSSLENNTNNPENTENFSSEKMNSQKSESFKNNHIQNEVNNENSNSHLVSSKKSLPKKNKKEISINNTSSNSSQKLNEEDNKPKINNELINSSIVNQTTNSVLKNKHSQIKKDTIKLITVKEKTAKRSNRNIRTNNIKNNEFDTIGQYQKVVETIIESKEEPLAIVSKPEVTNPRMVKLTAEEELNASKKITLQPIKNNEPVKTQTTVLAKNNTEKIASKSIAKNEYSNSVFQKLKDASNQLANKKFEFYPGMSVGINYALSSHNYGGFHFGINNVIPINNYFSVLSELKIFYKRNSGFTVNDIQSHMINYTEDNITLASQNKTIYNYQVDSTTKKYNFKSFTTLELPIVLQAHIGKFMPYLGANLAYAFRLNITTIPKQYIRSNVDTLDNTVAQPISVFETKNYQYAPKDFSSRFGLGFTVGTSYNINSVLNVDLRFSNVLWDNSKTTTAKTISSEIFKIPFIQFSLGYRFKKFNPGN